MSGTVAAAKAGIRVEKGFNCTDRKKIILPIYIPNRGMVICNQDRR